MGDIRAAAQPVAADGAAPPARDLHDYAGRGNLKVRCRSCGHFAIFCPAALARWFDVNRYSTEILAAARRFRCSFCLTKTASLETSSADITAMWLPSNEAQWKFFEQRMRWLRGQWMRTRR